MALDFYRWSGARITAHDLAFAVIWADGCLRACRTHALSFACNIALHLFSRQIPPLPLKAFDHIKIGKMKCFSF